MSSSLMDLRPGKSFLTLPLTVLVRESFLPRMADPGPMESTGTATRGISSWKSRDDTAVVRNLLILGWKCEMEMINYNLHVVILEQYKTTHCRWPFTARPTVRIRECHPHGVHCTVWWALKTALIDSHFRHVSAHRALWTWILHLRRRCLPLGRRRC
jgi:hypothetical protein